MIKYSFITCMLVVSASSSILADSVKRPLPVSITINPASFISVSGTVSNNKFILNWTVGNNQTADQFEIEKSTDGVTFTMAALVFGTDKDSDDSYQFYEKAVAKKTFYRIKVINKNKSVGYSKLIEINPVS